MSVVRRHAATLSALLAACDVAFFVSLAALCDAMPRSARLVPLYLAAAIIFVLRCYHYYRLAEAVRRYAGTPFPVSEARPLLVAALYGVLATLLELFNGTGATYVPLSAPAHAVFFAAWALAVAGNFVHAFAQPSELPGPATPRHVAADPVVERSLESDEESDDERLFDSESQRRRFESAIKRSPR